jgi:hypothetical protein
MMVFKKIHISSILSSLAALFAGLALSACFDIPSTPDESQKVQNVSIYVKQEGEIDSTLLKIHPQNSAKIYAVVHPDQYSENLSFKWYRESEEDGDILLGSKTKYLVNKKPAQESIPNKLIVTDTEGNSLVTNFEIIINTPPQIDSIVSPQPSDTLYGNSNTSFLFEWVSHDNDNEYYTHTVLIDGTSYVVGEFSSIRQSGFDKGEHTFQVVVTDNYGDNDSSAVITFYVAKKRD